jgi:hypothetical protein
VSACVSASCSCSIDANAGLLSNFEVLQLLTNPEKNKSVNAAPARYCSADERHKEDVPGDVHAALEVELEAHSSLT